jgi:hypothetical protein
MELIRCKAVPHDAKLKNFDVFGKYAHEDTWNKNLKRLEAELTSPEIRFVLRKYACEVIIKKGFKWDGGSVPRAQWTTAAPPFGTRYDLPFLLHDGTYAAQLFSRAQCDWILVEFLQEVGVCWYKRNKIWITVKAFGGFTWGKHTEQSIEEARKYVEIIPIRPVMLAA